jgi:hypothetical protein
MKNVRLEETSRNVFKILPDFIFMLNATATARTTATINALNMITNYNREKGFQ